MLNTLKNKISRIVMCKKCYSFYYAGSWHLYAPESIRNNDSESALVRFAECPACNEIDIAEDERDADLSRKLVSLGLYTNYA